MPEFDSVTQFNARPLWAAESNKKLANTINKLFYRYAREKPNGRIKFKQNDQGQFLDNQGNVINIDPNAIKFWSAPNLSNDSTFNAFMQKKGAVPEEELTPYQRYEGERVEGFNPLQKKIHAEAENLPAEAGASQIRPEFTHLSRRTIKGGGTGTNETIANAKELMNPYQDLFNSWEDQSKKKFEKRLKSEINPAFIASGTWGGGGHRKFQHEALQENEKELRHAQSQYLNQAMEKALERGDKETQRRLETMRDLKNDEENVFKKKLAAMGVRDTFATQQQRLGQQGKDIAYQEFVREKEHPAKTAKELSDINMAYQHNVPSEITQMNIGTHPSVTNPSMQSVQGGLGLIGAGMLGRQGAQMAPWAEGGHLEEPHYAGGGQTAMHPNSQQSFLGPQRLSPLDLVKAKVGKQHPISAGIPNLFGSSLEMERSGPTDADLHLNSPEIGGMRKHASNLENTPHTPFWDAIGGFGAGMLRGKGKNTLEMLQGGGAEAWDTFNKSHADKEAREDKITNLNKAIEDTRQLQMDREMNYRQIRDTLNINKVKANAEDKRANQRLALDEKKYNLEERKLEKHEAIEMAKLGRKYSNEPFVIGDRVIQPKKAVKMTAADVAELNNIDKDLKVYEEKKAPYQGLQSFLKEKTPKTGLLAEYTPNFSEISRDYARKLKKVVGSELPPGPATAHKIAFAEAQKPTERDTPEAVKSFAEKGIKAIDELEEGKILAREYAAYDIPPRITLGAYQKWVNEGKPEGKFEDYLADILEGTHTSSKEKSSPKSDEKYSDEEILRVLNKKAA